MSSAGKQLAIDKMKVRTVQVFFDPRGSSNTHMPHLDVKRERPDGAGVGAVFAAVEGADLSHGDLLDCWLDPRLSRASTRSVSAATAEPQP
jgi:hypothetical protein